MNHFHSLTERLISAMEMPDIVIPVSGVKFFKKTDTVPDEILQLQPDNYSITSCHALKASMLDDAVYLEKESIGCIAAAISLGLVEKKAPEPLKGKRVYTELMRKSSGKGHHFTAPSPLDFSNGSVYACKDSGNLDFSLFGKEDSGRFKKKDIAIEAIARMPSIQPAIMQGIFYFSPKYDDVDIIPDVVVLSLRPVELCRIIQGYQFLTGERVRADIGGLRAGCSDLIVKPYLYQEINFSPYSLYELAVQGVEESKTGFPFSEYPGAGNSP